MGRRQVSGLFAFLETQCDSIALVSVFGYPVKYLLVACLASTAQCDSLLPAGETGRRQGLLGSDRLKASVCHAGISSPTSNPRNTEESSTRSQDCLAPARNRKLSILSPLTLLS